MKTLLATAMLFVIASPLAGATPPISNERLAGLLAEIVQDAVPREYDRKKDWGRQKRITTGLRVDGKLRSLSLSRRKKAVDHGTWKHYKVRVVQHEEKPDEGLSDGRNDGLSVRIENLRSLDAGRAAFTLVVDADVAGWARVRRYNRGIHLGTITAEGTSSVTLSVDGEVGFVVVAGKPWPALELDPKVTKTSVTIRDFRLDRLSKLDGKVAREIGRGLKRVLEDKLDGPKLTKKLNASIDRKRDRLRLSLSALAQAPAKAEDAGVN